MQTHRNTNESLIIQYYVKMLTKSKVEEYIMWIIDQFHSFHFFPFLWLVKYIIWYIAGHI